MKLESAERRVASLENRLAPKPTIINCTGAKEELLAMLERYRDDEDTELTEEDKQLEAELSSMIDTSLKRIEETYNVRFVSYG